MSTLPLLQVEDLTVSYATHGARFLAVKSLSFTMAAGEIFGLVGESGSGKTTTAMAILRLIKPPAHIDAGRIMLGEVNVLTLDANALRQLRWQAMSLIPQGAMNSLNPVLRIKEQLTDVIITHEGRQPRAAVRERIMDLLRAVGLPPRVYTMYPHELSGGMKQRVCIAMAIALRPQLIIADEPTSALDVVVQRMVAETLKEVQSQLHAAVLLIGHDMGLQAQLVDRLGVMHRGRLVEVGAVRDVFKEPLYPYTQTLINAIPRLGRRQVGAPGQEVAAAGSRSAAPHWDETAPLREVRPGHFAALG
jgi:peptide/nickel transport system ATP-binding protein